MRLVATILAASALIAPAAAFAAPVAGGTSVLRVLVPIFPNTITAVSPATDSGAGCLDDSEGSSGTVCDVFFPVTGGDFELSAASPYGATGTLFHGGSAVLTLTPPVGALTTVNISDIRVNFDTNVVTADIAELSADDFEVFNFLGPVTPDQLTDLSAPLLQVNFSAGFATVLSDLGFAVAAGDRFGTFATSPEFAEVPAPAALALFGLGIVGLGFRRR